MSRRDERGELLDALQDAQPGKGQPLTCSLRSPRASGMLFARSLGSPFPAGHGAGQGSPYAQNREVRIREANFLRIP